MHASHIYNFYKKNIFIFALLAYINIWFAFKSDFLEFNLGGENSSLNIRNFCLKRQILLIFLLLLKEMKMIYCFSLWDDE